MQIVILCLCAYALSDCTYAIQDIATVPAQPTYQQDVMPFLSDHCVLCHGSPPDRGAPSTFRLDVYDDPSGKVPGAAGMANSSLYDIQIGRMPPGGGLGPNALRMIQNWVNNGTPQ